MMRWSEIEIQAEDDMGGFARWNGSSVFSENRL